MRQPAGVVRPRRREERRWTGKTCRRKRTPGRCRTRPPTSGRSTTKECARPSNPTAPARRTWAASRVPAHPPAGGERAAAVAARSGRQLPPAPQAGAAPMAKKTKHVGQWFEQFAQKATFWTGTTWAFILAIATILVWAITGPIFRFSDTWQLVINTGT